MNRLGTLLSVSLLQSCIVNHAFIPTGYEPSLLERKNDCHLTSSIEPFRMLKFNYCQAVSDKLGLGISNADYFGFFSAEAHGFYYKNTDFFSMDLGGGFQYAKNDSKLKGIPYGLSGSYYTQDFNISSYSPFLAGSFVFKTSGTFNLGISLKASYTLIGNFRYYQRIDSYQGISNPTPLDEETLTQRPPPFFTLEPAIHVFSRGEYSSISLQLGYNARNSTYAHPYSFTQNTQLIVQSSTNHPVINAICLNVGLTVFLNKFVRDKKDSQKRYW